MGLRKELGGKDVDRSSKANVLKLRGMAAWKSTVGPATYQWFTAVESELHWEIQPETRQQKRAQGGPQRWALGTIPKLQLYRKPTACHCRASCTTVTHKGFWSG